MPGKGSKKKKGGGGGGWGIVGIGEELMQERRRRCGVLQGRKRADVRPRSVEKNGLPVGKVVD